MKSAHFLTAAAAVLALAGCNGEQGTAGGNVSSEPIEAIPAPEGGDWSQMVSKTPEGGFLMGNPQADVKLIEFASMTCPHCASFHENGLDPLVENYVKSGRVSLEFRNFVFNPIDMTASLIARCNDAQGFFPLTSALFESQQQWIEQFSSLPAEQQQAIQSQPPEQQFVAIADAAGLQQWAAQRGVPSGKSRQCLTNQQAIDQLVQMRSDATSQYNVPGTPAFAINGELAESVTSWQSLEPAIREALGQ